MKVVLLAGGLGTRLSEETTLRPKPMVEIGGRPILVHIMEHYARYGHRDFFVALGYKAEVVKEYFLNYYYHNSDFAVDLRSGQTKVFGNGSLDASVNLIDTGLHTMTGGRLKRLERWIGRETHMLTYGDGVSNVDIDALLAFHRSHGKLATVTAVRPSARFGGIEIDGSAVTNFKEKPRTGEGWINGGFFVFEPGVFDYLREGDETVLEGAPLEELARDGQLMAFQHDDFWQCMDTVRDRQLLERLWASGEAPWKAPRRS